MPHALRLAIGNDQRVLLPACALAGGALLVLADTVARTVVAPQQLPVGAGHGAARRAEFPRAAAGARAMTAAPVARGARSRCCAPARATLVSQLALRVHAGELWCVLGPNGSGKTTLLHTLAGLRAPAAGSVHCLGHDIAHGARPSNSRAGAGC